MGIDINKIGKHLQSSIRTTRSERKPNSVVLTEKEVFVGLISRLEASWDNSIKLAKNFEINMMDYESDLYVTIEDLILLKYGEWKSEIIFWYIYARIDENGSICPLILNHTEEIVLENSTHLWDFLERLEREKK